MGLLGHSGFLFFFTGGEVRGHVGYVGALWEGIFLPVWLPFKDGGAPWVAKVNW